MAIALATYNFIIKYRAGKINFINILLKRPLGTKGLLKENIMLLLL